jgi:hypothetical protein
MHHKWILAAVFAAIAGAFIATHRHSGQIGEAPTAHPPKSVATF